MDWPTLLCADRLGRPDAIWQLGRTPFQQDIDRIVFSEAFRRLAHKTQVHPLSENDHVHTRLTHSIEVASVGRSLGTMVGHRIAPRLKTSGITEDTFGYIVQAACLAHDIGNPPFGHAGESAIGAWFTRKLDSDKSIADDLTDAQRNDLENFEGNAQGFRILTQLENYRWLGGLQLTFAVLGAFAKYPHSAEVHPIPHEQYVGGKKIGFFSSERDCFASIATRLGLPSRPAAPNYWSRHPLAFLVEAADDICYAIIDIEDGFQLKYVSFEDAQEILIKIAGDVNSAKTLSSAAEIGKLRAVAIGELVDAVVDAFVAHEADFLNGSFSDELIAKTEYGLHIREAKRLAREMIYESERKTKIEIAGSEIIAGLLDLFIEVVVELKKKNWSIAKLSNQNVRLARLMGDGIVGAASTYDCIMRVTDFISGMTDRYALDLYRKLKGISV